MPSKMISRSCVFALVVAICTLRALAQSPTPPEATDNEQFVGYWTTETGWHSELQLRNNRTDGDLVVTPALRLADGAETALAPVTIKPQEVQSLDLEAAITSAAPQLVGTYGSVVLRYHSNGFRNLYAAMMVHNVGHPIAFHIDATGQSLDYQAGSREGVWWLPKDTTSDYLILTNQGSDTIPLDLSLYDASGQKAEKLVLLGPRETNRYSLRKLVQAVGLKGSYGGIKVAANTHAGSLDTQHFLFDETAGFSAVLKMFDHDPNVNLEERDFAKTAVWTTRAPMLALSNPDPALAFPAGTTLRPQLFVRNTNRKPVDVGLRFNWHGSGATGKGPQTALHLNPYETRRVDVAALAFPKEANWTSVTMTTNDGQPDEVMAVAASYDDTLRFGAQTPFSDQLSFQWEGGMWEFDPRHDSIISAGNGGTKPTHAAFTIFYNQGTARYDLEQTLQPDEQMWIDVGKLIREHVQDKNGKTLPDSLTSGSYEFRDLTDVGVGSLFEGKVIYDKTYGHVTYGCATCCGYTPPVRLSFNPLNIPFLGSFQNDVLAYNYCSDMMSSVGSSFYFNWGTGNAAIARVDGYGTHTGVSVGSTTSATSGLIASQGGKICPLRSFHPVGGVGVVPGFTVGYNAFIDIDHVQGALSCSFTTGGPPVPIRLIYIGDANRGTYRTAEQIHILPDLNNSSGFFQNTGKSRSYGKGSPANGVTLSSPGADDDNIPDDCYLWHHAAQATPNFSHDETYPVIHQGQVHYTGAASNPLESPLATITWDMRTVIDTTNQLAPTASVNYNHTCFPAHQIVVNGTVVYVFHPVATDPASIFDCLVNHINKRVGVTTAKTVPGH
jgi:hypothetical protein